MMEFLSSIRPNRPGDEGVPLEGVEDRRPLEDKSPEKTSSQCQNEQCVDRVFDLFK